MRTHRVTWVVAMLVAVGAFQQCTCAFPIDRAYDDQTVDQAQMVALVTANAVDLCPWNTCEGSLAGLIRFSVDDVLAGNFLEPQRLFVTRGGLVRDALAWFNGGRPVQLLVATSFQQMPESPDGGLLAVCGARTGETLHTQTLVLTEAELWWITDDGTRLMSTQCVLSAMLAQGMTGARAQLMYGRDRFCSWSRAAAMEEIERSRQRAPSRPATLTPFSTAQHLTNTCEPDAGQLDGG